MNIQNKNFNTMRTAVLLISTAVLTCATSGAVYAKTAKVGFAPSVDAQLTVVTSDGSLRVYPSPSGVGTVYYTYGSNLPIKRGDKIKLSVNVATGDYSLKHVKVRLDNTLVADITSAPWDSIFDTGAMTVGNHAIEVWVQSDSPAPASSNSEVLNFFVADDVPMVPAATAPLTTKVLGIQQTSIGGTTTTTNTTPAITLPAPIANSHESDQATVAFTFDNAQAASDYAAGKPISVTDAMHVIVTVPKGSTARKFVYALVRNNATDYTSDTAMVVNYTRILLLPRTDAGTGLNPGNVTLMAWGIDDQNNYGPAATLNLSVASGSGETK